MTWDERLKEAEQAVRQEEYERAIDLMLQLVSEDPDDAEVNARAHVILAHAYLNLEDYNEAMHAVQRALALHPRQDLGMAIYAYLLGKFNQPRLAQEAFDAAFALNNSRAITYYWNASFLLEAFRQSAEARRQLRTAMSLEPGMPEHHLLMARIYLTEGRDEEAEKEFQSAVRLQPTFHVLNSYGLHLLYRRGDPERAFEYFRRALRIRPKNRQVLQHFMTTLRAKNRLMYEFWQFNFRVLGMGGKLRWFSVLGLWLLIQVMQIVAQARPEWKPFISPIVIAYIIFCIYTWLINPIFRLMIRQGWLR